MKLLTKTGIYYFIITLILFAAGGTIFYFSLRNIINGSITEHIYDIKNKVASYVKKTGSLPSESPIDIYKVEFSPILNKVPAAETLRDTILEDEDGEMEPFRVLLFLVQVEGKNYSARISRQLMESDDLIESIAYSLSILTGILLTVLFLLNWWFSKNLWKPFYHTLDELKRFDLNKKEHVKLPSVNISEFRILNEEIRKMTGKIQQDYQNLKEFTENASHEIQTPLAIIRSKAELMIQSDNIPAEQQKLIQDIYESTNRLSKLNQSLLLLAKIENQQFHETQTVNLKKLIDHKLVQFEDMIAFKNITIENKSENVELKMNPQLADILLSNVIANAIRHNVKGGKIILELKNKSFTISNSGNPLTTSPDKLFERFQKASSSGDSVGLGLSIVKQICDTYRFSVDYSFSENIHTVKVVWE
ncbi:MAG TPA: HAMP domain-containing sensor histidine kinase [Bacteroidia bacterium]